MKEHELKTSVKTRECSFIKLGVSPAKWILIFIALLIMAGRVATSFDVDIAGIWIYHYRNTFTLLLIGYGFAFPFIYLKLRKQFQEELNFDFRSKELRVYRSGDFSQLNNLIKYADINSLTVSKGTPRLNKKYFKDHKGTIESTLITINLKKGDKLLRYLGKNLEKEDLKTQLEKIHSANPDVEIIMKGD